MTNPCPSCGAPIPDGGACHESFDLLLSWEWEYQMQDVHHLLVACYHIQHPHLYSQEGLAGALDLLRRWVVEGEYVFDVRESIRGGVSNSQRDYPITARPDNIGAFHQPIAWTMTAADVVAAGPDRFYDSVCAWAAGMVEALRSAGEMV